MKFKDADLVRAFESLNADAATDAARVLAAIPTVPPVTRPLWPIITMAALGGAAISALIAWLMMPIPAPAEELEKEEPDPPAVEEKEELLPKKLDELLPPPEIATDLALGMSIGEINLLTATSSAPVIAGQHLAFGQTYQTAENSMVQIGLGGNAMARIGPATRLIFEDERSINLISGLLWLQNGQGRGAIYVITNEGDIEIEPDSVVSLSAEEDEIRLASLIGHASFDTIASGKLRLGDSQFCKSTGGLVEDPTDSQSSWYYFRWQVPLLTRFDQNEEIVNALATLSLDLANPDRRNTANEEFRRLGSLGPLALARAMEGLVDQGELRQFVVGLFCDIADRNSVEILMNLLRSDSGEERVLAAETLQRVSGIAIGRESTFWRDEPFSDREAARQEWRRRLNRIR